MVLNNSKWVKVTIGKAGKGESFHWKPLQVPHRGSMAELNWDASCIGTDTYKATQYFVISFMQIFWLWFVFGIEIKKEKIGESKYVRYEATHFQALDEELRENTKSS